MVKLLLVKVNLKNILLIKNIRNTVSGIVNSITIDPTLAQFVEFVAYEIVDPFDKFSNMRTI